jgi:hypothetical protein
MMISPIRVLVVVLTTLIGCGAESRPLPDSTQTAVAGIPSVERNRADALEQTAREIVEFLRGNAPFETIALADTVTLYLSPDGGGILSAFSREQLRRPSQWVLRSGRQTYAFAPPASLKKMTAKADTHFDCLDYPLASRFPELAKLPHVGVKLEPDGAGSCLQTWNATFVFDTSAPPARLVAAVYDQWEW